MKNNNILLKTYLVSCLLLLSSYSIGQRTHEYYVTGEIHCTYQLKDGNKHGKYREYFKSGHLSVKGYFFKGNEIGIWKYYYDNNLLKAKVWYWLNGEMIRKITYQETYR